MVDPELKEMEPVVNEFFLMEQDKISLRGVVEASFDEVIDTFLSADFRIVQRRTRRNLQ